MRRFAVSLRLTFASSIDEDETSRSCSASFNMRLFAVLRSMPKNGLQEHRMWLQPIYALGDKTVAMLTHLETKQLQCTFVHIPLVQLLLLVVLLVLLVLLIPLVLLVLLVLLALPVLVVLLVLLVLQVTSTTSTTSTTHTARTASTTSTTSTTSATSTTGTT